MISLSSRVLATILWVLLLGCSSSSSSSSSGWKQCGPDEGGGKCPDHNTCCPTKEAGVSSCIPAKRQDSDTAFGQCCDADGETGCAYGYECSAKDGNDGADASAQLYCKLQENHPEYVYNDTSRYELCRVPVEMQNILGFPIKNKEEEEDGSFFQVAYYSNMGDVTVASNAHLGVEKVLIMIHGSERNANDYFCASLSLLDQDTTTGNTLVIVPIFAAPEDGYSLDNLLLWADRPDDSYALPHSWRYGADAINAPISSYAVLDYLLEFLVSAATMQFPNLKRVALAGHSAGGQVTHRWALLSNSPAWAGEGGEGRLLDIVSVVANPRSYCYLDDRRVLSDGSFNVPDRDTVNICPNYNKWQWGLDEGGFVSCPYRDRALKETPSLSMAQRYSTRKVIYLSGELDMMPTIDRCETDIFQGKNRQQRAKNYIRSLQEYFGRHVHELHIIDGSPHDHTLMFQSHQGTKAIFGDQREG